MKVMHDEIIDLINAGELVRVIKGEVCRYQTPPEINNDMQPTDHSELLEKAIYPLARSNPESDIKSAFVQALMSSLADGLGVYSSIQCFFIQIINEDAKEAEFDIDRNKIARSLAQAFISKADELHQLEFNSGDLALDRSYRLTLSRMNILSRDHGIDWGIQLPKL